MSQNVWNTQMGSKGKDSTGRFMTFAQDAKDYDILLVQEVFILSVGPLKYGMEDAILLEKELIQQGFKFHTNLYNTLPYVGQNSGLQIFSKYPLVDVEYVSFHQASMHEYMNWKGAVKAKVEIGDGKSLTVVNVHFDSGSNANIRKSQIQDVKQLIQKIPTTDALVVTGDFNICPRTHDDGSEYSHLTETLSPLLDIFPGSEPTFRYGSASYDHMFVNDKLKITNSSILDLQSTGNIVSDHFGLAATLEL